MFILDTFTPPPRPWAPPATGVSVAALVCGIIGTLAAVLAVGVLAIPSGIVAIVLGVIASRRNKITFNRFGLARAGWILGLIAIAW
jgi:predicted membrane chloride channel (bestrophin family)